MTVGFAHSIAARGRASAVIPARLGFESVTKAFGATDVVRGVSFTVEEGEVLCLLGPSGCGKSTLLRLAAGIDTPSAGRILLDGREIAGPSAFVPPELRGIGLVFQDYALFPHLTVRDNVMFGLSDLPRAERGRIAAAALARVGLDALADAYPEVLSGGEQQRVALARAVVPRPRVLLLDEPFSNLDRRMRDSVRDDTITLLRETGATAILVTHDPEEAMRVADRIALMRAGRIAQIGLAKTLYECPVDLEAARFFCEINEVPGLARGGRVETPVGVFPAPHVADGPAIVALRPQSLRIRAPGFCLAGRLLERRFLGEVDLFEIVVGGLDKPLKARRTGAPADFQPGQDIGVDIIAAEALVFPSLGA